MHRGQRVFCSNRGQRGGCGQTFSLHFADVLPRHTFPASLFWQLLLRCLAGASVKAAAEGLRLPFALETCYRIRRRLRERLDVLRVCLCQRQPAPSSPHPDPLGQTVEHLRAVFPGHASPLAAFQLDFARPLLG